MVCSPFSLQHIQMPHVFHKISYLFILLRNSDHCGQVKIATLESNVPSVFPYQGEFTCRSPTH